MILAFLLLITGLTISAVAIYYSVIGLAAIFAAATVPIYIMGGSLEVAKLVCASWLKANWDKAPKLMKSYMIIAVVVLMVITSMGIFGFLSKAHTDQSIVSGDASAQLSIFDEKIKTAKDNIEANRKVIKQMDDSVDQVMSRSTSETGADKAVSVRKSQAKERARLLAEIQAEQKIISNLNEERAPIAAQNRKIEAEVGPIKYIAKLIYGDNPDTNLLEKAVTWVIILIVVVFDPLAVIMLLAAQMTFAWIREQQKIQSIDENVKELDNKEDLSEEQSYITPQSSSVAAYEPDAGPLTNDQINQIKHAAEYSDLKKYPYLSKQEEFWKKPAGWKSEGPIVHKPEILPSTEVKVELALEPVTEEVIATKEIVTPVEEVVVAEEIVTAVEEEHIEKENNKVEDTYTEVTSPSETEIADTTEIDVLKKKIHDQGSESANFKDEEVTYVQNGEQGEGSLWNRLRRTLSDEFKPKDYLVVEYSRSNFEDLYFDVSQDVELAKFIRDIQTGTSSFGDYPQEQIKYFASRIYELRKNQFNNAT